MSRCATDKSAGKWSAFRCKMHRDTGHAPVSAGNWRPGVVDGVGLGEDELADGHHGVAVVDETGEGWRAGPPACAARRCGTARCCPAAPGWSPAGRWYPRRSPSSPGNPYRQRLEAVAAQGIAGLVAMRIRQEFDLPNGVFGGVSGAGEVKIEGVRDRSILCKFQLRHCETERVAESDKPFK